MNSFAQKYQQILIDGNASKLHTLSKDVRRSAMRALVHLSKFNGCYEEWQKIVKQNGLRWKEADDNFNFFDKENITEMLEYVKQIVRSQPPEYGNTFIFATLTGLRADESCQAIRLIKSNTKDYFNAEYGVLEHFKYKEIFIRRSKKAFISLVDSNILNLAKGSCDSYPAINSFLKRQKIETHMAYCRKIFGTWLRQNGIESEFVELLQGRTPTSIFAKHYYRPDFKKEIQKVRTCLDKLSLSIRNP